VSVKVKICGITNADDALAAIEGGADVLGFVFHPASPRYVSAREAEQIVKPLPPFVVKAGVFVDADRDVVLQAARACGLNILQFHGNETPDYCLQFGLMCMKAFRIKDADSLSALPRYGTDAWLLDAWIPGVPGGTGETFNWELAVEAGKLGKPIFLSGGLNAENVGAAISQVRPYGVDVSSGVEKAPGKKDHAKVKAFIKAAKAIL